MRARLGNEKAAHSRGNTSIYATTLHAQIKPVTIEGADRSLKQALAYAKRGWHVFPCRAGSKKPITEHGFKDATTDTMTLNRWWNDRIVCNVAIATGRPSGLFVIDVDSHKPGCEFSDLARLPKTYTVKTASGGQHFYFRLPHGTTLRSGNDKLGRFVDVKADGGYVLAPPSAFNGGLYRLAIEVPLASAPNWLLRRLLSLPQQPEGGRTEGGGISSVLSVLSVQSVTQAVSMSLPSREHANHVALFKLARALKAFEISTGALLSPAQKSAAFQDWYGQTLALGLLRQGQARDDYMSEFLSAWQHAQWPLGNDPVQTAWQKAQLEALPPEAAHFEGESRKRLVALCWQLHLAAKGHWFLAGRTAAQLLGAKHRTVALWLSNLVALGVLEIVSESTTVKARRYRFLTQNPKEGTIQ